MEHAVEDSEIRFQNMTVESEHLVVYRGGTSGVAQATGITSATSIGAMFAQRDDMLYLLKENHPAMQAVSKNCSIPSPLTPLQRIGPTLSIGGLNSSSPFHQHPENWFAQVIGSKAWVVSPNEISLEAIQKQGLEPCEQHYAATAAQGFKRCTLHAGEVLYLPSQWHHGTCNVANFSLGVGFIGPLDHLPKLHFAAAVGNLKDIEEYVAQGVQQTDREGRQALHWAASRGHAAAVRSLIALRADVKALDGNGGEPLHLAAFDGHVAAARALSKKAISLSAATHAGAQPLHLAASRGHATMVKYLLDRNAVVRAKDVNGAEPLHMAAYEGHMKVAELLLRRRASAAASSEAGATPIQLARSRAHHDLASMLVSAGSEEL